MRAAVVDASVAVKWFVPEEFSERADALAESGWTLLAPRLILLEVANSLWKKIRRRLVTPEDAHEHLSALPRFFDELFEHDDLVAPALSLAATLDHPIYDFVYVHGARRHHAVVVTADTRLMGRLRGSPYEADVVHLADWQAAPS
jgi:hypothetical protein